VACGFVVRCKPPDSASLLDRLSRGLRCLIWSSPSSPRFFESFWGRLWAFCNQPFTTAGLFELRGKGVEIEIYPEGLDNPR
jgi:hypothetical protein